MRIFLTTMKVKKTTKEKCELLKKKESHISQKSHNCQNHIYDKLKQLVPFDLIDSFDQSDKLCSQD